MLLEVLLDSEGYITTYSYLDIYGDGERLSSIEGSIDIELDVEKETFDIISHCYKVIEGVITLDQVKVDLTYADLAEPKLTVMDQLLVDVEYLKDEIELLKNNGGN